MLPAGCARPALSSGSALVLALALAGCGGGGGGGAISAPPPPVVTPPTTPPPTTPPPPTSFDTREDRRSNGPQQHGAIRAWQGGSTGAGQTIAIVDSGIDADSPEFAGRILAASRDVTGAGRSIEAEDDHGTNVALVAAAARDGLGVVGMAFDASLLVLRADQPGSCSAAEPSGGEPSCSFLDSSVARGVDAAVAAGARVVNLSLGGSDGAGSALRAAVARAAAAGVLVVVAAGNGGAGDRPGVDPAQPSTFAQQIRAAGGDNVLIVGSVDAGNMLSSFSQRAGSQAAWYLSARGERVCCVYENGQVFVGQGSDGAYNLLFSGTSFAAPQVTGAVALLAQAFPSLTAQQIARLLLETARDAGEPGTDAVYGRGILDIAAAFTPRGALTLAGGTAVVRPGDQGATASPAMGDALAGGMALGAVALDSYARAYQVDLGTGMGPAALQDRLHGALAGTARVASGGAGAVALAFTVDPGGAGLGIASAQALRLTGVEADGAQVLAARVAARIAPGTELAFGVRESGSSLAAQLQGSRQAAFLIAREADADIGFARIPGAAAAVRHRIGATGLTVSVDSGWLWRGVDRPFAERLPGGPVSRQALSSLALSADRPIGPADAAIGLTLLREEASVLGAVFAPVFGLGGARTAFLDASLRFAPAEGWEIAGAWRQGWTRIDAVGLAAQGSRFASNGWSLDIARAGVMARGDSLGLRLSQPLRVSSGGLALMLPVAWDYATSLPGYGVQQLSLVPTGREIDGELAWRGPVWGGSAGASLFYRRQPGHQSAMPDDVGAALRWSRAF